MLDEICARAILDRRRLEEGHMKYAVLRVYKWYPKFLPAMTMASSIQQILEDMTPTFYNAFSMYYSSKYMCTCTLLVSYVTQQNYFHCACICFQHINVAFLDVLRF